MTAGGGDQMAERTEGYQEEVLSDLLDLQAELRGDPRAPAEPAAASGEPAAPDGDVVMVEQGVTVAEGGLEVTVAPSGAAVTQRLVALNDRLGRLERELDSVTRRIEDAEEAPPKPPAPTDADAPWRSFLDLQKIVADRLDGR
jgi:hypothetical protein